MAKIKDLFLTIQQAFSQIMRSVLGRDESNDKDSLSTQKNRYYS